MKELDLSELASLEAKATPGPWRAECMEHPRPTPRKGEWEHWVKFGTPGEGMFLDCTPTADEGGEWSWNGYSEGPDSRASADCALIAAMRNMAPALIKALTEARETIQELEGDVANHAHSIKLREDQADRARRLQTDTEKLWNDEIAQHRITQAERDALKAENERLNAQEEMDDGLRDACMDKLLAAEAERDALKAQLDQRGELLVAVDRGGLSERARAEAAEARNADLLEGLRPFAEHAKVWSEDEPDETQIVEAGEWFAGEAITLADFRRAASLLHGAM